MLVYQRVFPYENPLETLYGTLIFPDGSRLWPPLQCRDTTALPPRVERPCRRSREHLPGMAMQQEPIDWDFLGLCKGNIPTKYGLIWISTSILESWNSHWSLGVEILLEKWWLKWEGDRIGDMQLSFATMIYWIGGMEHEEKVNQEVRWPFFYKSGYDLTIVGWRTPWYDN